MMILIYHWEQLKFLTIKAPGVIGDWTRWLKRSRHKEFVRVRIGYFTASPQDGGPAGKVKKPQGEKAVIDFILSKFKSAEMEIMKKTFKK